MKIIVVHGDYITKSYARLTKFLETARKRNWEVIENKIETTPSLFGRERLFVFRGYQQFLQNGTKNLLKFPGTLIIYQESVIPQTFLKALTKSLPTGRQDTKIENYELPKLIWNFLDNPNVKLLHRLIKHEPIEFIFVLLAKRFRDLYWLKTDEKTFPKQGWFVSKLKKQAVNYSAGELKELISELARIDIEVKSSRADLLSSLDFLLITKVK